jgi:hypothetical protein
MGAATRSFKRVDHADPVPPQNHHVQGYRASLFGVSDTARMARSVVGSAAGEEL